MRMPKRAVLAAVLSLALVSAACGGGDSGDELFSTSIGPEGQVNIDEPIDNIPGVSESCEALANLSLAMTQAITGDVGNTADFIAAAKAKAPGEIQADIDALAEGLLAIEAFYQEVGNPMTDPNFFTNVSEEDMERFDELFDNEAMDTAFENLGEWAESECALGG